MNAEQNADPEADSLFPRLKFDKKPMETWFAISLKPFSTDISRPLNYPDEAQK
jgi:hypothetical protein